MFSFQYLLCPFDPIDNLTLCDLRRDYTHTLIASAQIPFSGLLRYPAQDSKTALALRSINLLFCGIDRNKLGVL